MSTEKPDYKPDNEADVKAAIREEGINDLNMQSAFKAVLDTKSGQMVLAYILGECNVCNTTTFTGNSQTFFREGRRSIGLELMGWISEVDKDKSCELLIKSIKGEF